jgi:predicted MFS family arabinose efflux permease
MAATIPAALLMARIGRRPGFWLGTAIGGVGAVIATWAIFRGSFEWFCLGTFLLGANRGATQQYRFAAAEIADEAFRSKAISLVLAGGVVSAVFGAEVAKWSRDLFGVRRLLCLDPGAIFRVRFSAVFRRAAAAGGTGVGRRGPAVA